MRVRRVNFRCVAVVRKRLYGVRNGCDDYWCPFFTGAQERILYVCGFRLGRVSGQLRVVTIQKDSRDSG